MNIFVMRHKGRNVRGAAWWQLTVAAEVTCSDEPTPAGQDWPSCTEYGVKLFDQQQNSVFRGE